MSAPAVARADATDVEGIEKKVAEAKAEVAEAKKEVAEAKKEVAEAKKEVEKAENKVEKAKEGTNIELKATADLLLKIAVVGLQTAHDGVKSAQDGVKSAQKVLDDANEGLIAANKLARQTSQRLLDTTSGAVGGGAAGVQVSGAVSITPQEDFFQKLLERDERQRKELEERDQRQRKELLQIVLHLSQTENPWAGMARSSADSDASSSSDFRPRLLSFYYPDQNIQAPLRCVVTGILDNKTTLVRVVAARIWPKSQARSFPVHLVRGGANDVSNGIFLHKSIEEQFDQLRVCFVCNPFDTSAQFVVLHKDILDVEIPGTQKTLRGLHDKRLEFEKTRRPSFQLLSLYAVQALGHLDNTPWMSTEEKQNFETISRVGSPEN